MILEYLSALSTKIITENIPPRIKFYGKPHFWCQKE